MRDTNCTIFDLCPRRRCLSALIGWGVTTMAIIGVGWIAPVEYLVGSAFVKNLLFRMWMICLHLPFLLIL